ncbi:MAG: hypothetical protein H6953_15115 [Chromatiaceae bacterium]|nr:hypothetical protein [Chromatiaceae bacterium]MCP5421726.1 hypothetical protein [Chromatiaceae bacterium]
MEFDWVTFGSAISGAIVGGLIAGFFALRSTDKAFTHQRLHAKESEEKLISSLLQAVHDEIETIQDRYQETMGAKIEALQDNEPLNFYYPLVSDFFTVYNGNSFLLGRIADNDLRKQIIKTYTLAKGMVDSFRLNNDLVGKFETANKIFQETGEEIHKQHAAAHYGALVSYAKTLKAGHQSLKQEANLLLRTLRKHGVLSEKNN